MRLRWVVVTVLMMALFAINGIARLVVWQAGLVNDKDQILAGLLASVAAALLSVYAGARWTYRYRMPRVLADLAVAIAVAALLAVALGPYLGGSTPLVEGVGFAFRQFFFYGGVMAFGAVVGALVTVALGKDWKSRSWRYHEERIRSRPRRVT